MITDLDTFTKAYIEAALWSSSANISECDDCTFTTTTEMRKCPKCGAGLSGSDKSFQDMDLDTFAPETLAQIVADCAKFQGEQSDVIETAECSRGSGEYTKLEQAGHDFWLTRNGHGAGFWDGDWTEPAATLLTDAAKKFGEYNLYLGDLKEKVIYGT